MNEKISLQDLVVLLAEKSNITKKDAETLVKECFDIMEKGLENDKLLKIRNLGTFKLSWVEDRESVDVSTGERVLIPAHYKVTFSPDIELAERINTPYASMETVEIEGNEYREKIEDILDEDNDDEVEDEVDENSAKSGYFWGRPETQKKPESVNAKAEPEKPQEEPEVIEVKPEEPQEEPKVIEAEPEESQKEPEVIEAEPEEPQEEPEVIEAEPEEPQEEPEVIEAEPEEPQEEPEVIEVKPEEPEKEPEVIEVKPEEPQEEPEIIEVKPEEPEIMEIEKEKPEDKKEEELEDKDDELEYNKEEEPEYDELYDEDYNRRGANNGFFWFFFLVISVLILFFAARYFCPKIQTRIIEEAIPDSVVVFTYSVNQSQNTDSLKMAQKTDSATVQAINTQKKQVQNPSKTKTPTPPATKPATAPKTKATGSQPTKTGGNKQHEILQGERLNTIALREYGHKAFWVYIYDENRKTISNPDLIEPGMVISIPPAEKYGINKNNPESVNKALNLEQQYKKY
ncbi:MAG: HU family DNA-binding protein [Dysgonamonadaceae bacterium]|jgi:nucleoid DNA-binding protein|nr:HU family DNA-binding protein [Dysgonamonadaceae bacterium]